MLKLYAVGRRPDGGVCCCASWLAGGWGTPTGAEMGQSGEVFYSGFSQITFTLSSSGESLNVTRVLVSLL